jgi:hypothetical protein
MTNVITKIPPGSALLAHLKTEETPQNMLIAIEGLRRHLDENHVLMMREIELMQIKLRGILKEVQPTWNV